MSAFEVAFVSIIAISVTLMVVHLRIWFKSKSQMANLFLASAALGAAFLAIIELLQFNTTSIDSYNAIIKVSHIPIFIDLIIHLWVKPPGSSEISPLDHRKV